MIITYEVRNIATEDFQISGRAQKYFMNNTSQSNLKSTFLRLFTKFHRLTKRFRIIGLRSVGES